MRTGTAERYNRNMEEPFSFTTHDIVRVDSYRAVHKVSILAIVFSDIVGYTQLCERAPEVTLVRVRSAFDRQTAYCVEERHAGLIVKRIGDAILAIHAQPTAAVLASLELHESLAESPVGGISLQLRTGIHLGQVAVEEVGTHVDIFGRHVNRTARIQAVAEPGEILVTEPVEDNVRGWLEASHDQGISFVRRRTHVLKGLADPVTVYSVVRQSPIEIRPEDRLPACYLEIRVVNGPNAGRRFRFDASYDRRIILGRTQDCDIPLPDPRLSRKHAMIWSNNDRLWELSDLGSFNGTFLNGERVERHVIALGDEIRLGEIVLIVEALRHLEAGSRPSAAH